MITTADGTEVLLLAASDGAGTARHSDIGASLAVAHFMDHFESICAAQSVEMLNPEGMQAWFESLRLALQQRAEADGAAIEAYACTFLGAMIGEKASRYLQLGDGAIVVRAAPEDRGEDARSDESSLGESDPDYAWIFWPQHGEYANSTYFVTQKDIVPLLQVESGPPVDEIALFTDGIERLVLDMARKTVHGPAFRPIFDWLATTEPDRSSRPSSALQAYLDSDHINRRTDDDKTLVMATRRTLVPESPAPDQRDDDRAEVTPEPEAPDERHAGGDPTDGACSDVAGSDIACSGIAGSDIACSGVTGSDEARGVVVSSGRSTAHDAD